MEEVKSPLIELYGDDAIEIALKEIEQLKLNSNIPFDREYVNLGISFSVIKAKEILENKRKHCSLPDLIKSSFGEAGIYKYNC